MPQLNILTFPSQIFWLLITFLSLFLLVKYVIMPRMEQILSARWERQDNNLQRATELKEEAEALLLRIDTLMEMAKEEAHHHLQTCEEKIKTESDQAHQALQADLTEKIVQAEKDLFKKKEKALKELPELVDQVSSMVLEKLQGTDLPKEKRKKPREKADVE